MDALKSSKQSLGAEAIWGLNDWLRDFAPPVLLNPTAAINFSPRLFNLLVTNFPGPQIPFYVLGHELTNIHPIGFLAQRHAVAIAILSYNGEVSFGLLVEPEAGAELQAALRARRSGGGGAHRRGHRGRRGELSSGPAALSRRGGRASGRAGVAAGEALRDHLAQARHVHRLQVVGPVDRPVSKEKRARSSSPNPASSAWAAVSSKRQLSWV